MIDALRPVPGARAACHVVDHASGALLSISIHDDEAAAEEAPHAAIARRTAERDHHGVPPDEIRLCEVVRLVDRIADQAAQELPG